MHSGVSTRVSPSIRMSAAAASIASYEVPDIRPMTLMKYPLLGSFRHSEKLRSVDECPLVGISSQGTQGDRTDGARCHHEVGRNIEIGSFLDQPRDDQTGAARKDRVGQGVCESQSGVPNRGGEHLGEHGGSGSGNKSHCGAGGKHCKTLGCQRRLLVLPDV